MTKSFVANFLIAAACGLLWTNFAAPAILRSLGVPIAFGTWRVDRRNQNLNRAQYVWAFGMFTWGLGMFLCFAIANYLDWKLVVFKSPGRVVGMLLTWLAAGWLIGVLTARHRENGIS